MDALGEPAHKPMTMLGELASWDFGGHVRQAGCAALVRGPVTTVQVNLGRRCNQACRHCHVGAGPNRAETMAPEVGARVIALLRASPEVRVLDLTGGAPELNPSFRTLVQRGRELGREVIDRCNLTVLLEPELTNLARFMADHQVRIVASLPCYGAENVNAQRGADVFERSVRVLRQLNQLGYGDPATDLALDLVYNPSGAFLPPAQSSLESAYRDRLASEFGIRFSHLLTITNLPIRRFADRLSQSGELESYMGLLQQSFNPATVGEVMCRNLVSVSCDGGLYDCDFNQVLDLPLGAAEATAIRTVWDLESFAPLAGHRVATGGHCFGCTAGAGSSCGGALRQGES